MGCRALSSYLKIEQKIIVNHKKIYRLCQQNHLLLSRKKKIKKFKKIANNSVVTGPNQLWQFDIKHGYIQGEMRAFYFAGFIDVYSKRLISFHLGYHCTALDLSLALKAAIGDLSSEEIKNLIIRSDNGSQMSSNLFKESVDLLELTHEFTPIRCPDKNAYIESFFSIFETEFLQVRYFRTMEDVRNQVNNWLEWYNTRRLHGSLKYLSPKMFLEKFSRGEVENYKVGA